MGGVPTGGSTIKNMAIGIITTVLAYLIVNVLLKKKPKDEDFEKRKVATIDAFHSVNDYMNLANLKFKTIACFSCDREQMKNEIVRELNLLSSNLQKIAVNTAVDEKLRSMAEITIGQFDAEKPLFENFLDSVQLVEKLPSPEKENYIASLNASFTTKLRHLQSRDTTEIKTFLKDINKKYKSDLEYKPNETVFDPTAIAHKWRVECTYYLDLRADKTVSLQSGEETTEGNWELRGHDLYLELTGGEKLHYYVRELSPKLMMLKFDGLADFNAACAEDRD